MQFQGFSPRSLEYLALVRLNDSKLWYDEHKDEYRQCLLAPFSALLADLTPTLTEIDPSLITNPRQSLSRIRRDTRFSKDKSLYRDNMWLSAKSSLEDWTRYPTFYFEISPVSYRYGMGYYDVPPSTMEHFRQAVTRDIEGFRGAVNGVTEHFDVRGACYKREKDPTLPDDIRLWYNRRELYVAHDGADITRLYDTALVEDLRAGFLCLAPLYRFLSALPV